MSTRDLLLIDLYNSPRDPQAHALAARYAPVLYFDTNEPFLPLAAGFTLFSEDERSPSFDRVIQLCPPGKPAAVMAIEYAIWWDWDIHHLYELEHVWVYVDTQGTVARVEGSWHGDLHEISVALEEGRPVLFSEPGKHAFAPSPDWFRKRASEVRRTETRSIGVHAGVLVNQMFTGKIRQRVFDRVLARSYLANQSFDPAWDFTKRFTFQADWLVTWPALYEWIPQRVNTWLERMQATTLLSRYRALHLMSSSGTLAGLQACANAGADAVLLPVSLAGERLITGDLSRPNSTLDIEAAYEFCSAEPMGAFLEPDSIQTAEHLADYVNEKGLQDYIVVTSPVTEWLKRYQELVTGGILVIQLVSPGQDPLEAAQQSGARFVNPRWISLSPEWIRRVHDAGLGLVGGPVEDAATFNALQRLGVDVVWQGEADTGSLAAGK